MLFFQNVGMSSVAEAAAGAFAFIFTVIAARLLGVEDYGLFQSLMGLYGILSFFILPLNLAVVHCSGKASPELKTPMIRRFLTYALLSSGTIFVLITAAAPWISRWMHTRGVFPVILAGMLVLSVSLLRVFYGFLQGEMQYRTFSFAKGFQGLITMLLGSLFIVTGWKVAGALAGYVCSMMILCIYFFFKFKIHHTSGKSADFEIRKELHNLKKIFFIFATLLLIEHAPAVLARIRLSHEDSGFFGALYNLRNVIWPFALAVMIPFYSQSISDKYQEKNLLKKGLMVIGILSGGFLGAGFFFPGLVLHILYGAGYEGAAAYFFQYGMSLTLQMVMMLVMFHQLSQNRIRSIQLLLPASLLLLCLLITGGSIPGLIFSQVIACSVYLALLLGQEAVCLIQKEN